MKQDFDLHLTKLRDKSRRGGFRKKGMKRYLAVLLSIVLATGTCLPAMAAEQPQTVETESAAVAPSAEAAAEADEEVPAVSEETAGLENMINLDVIPGNSRLIKRFLLEDFKDSLFSVIADDDSLLVVAKTAEGAAAIRQEVRKWMTDHK